MSKKSSHSFQGRPHFNFVNFLVRINGSKFGVTGIFFLLLIINAVPLGYSISLVFFEIFNTGNHGIRQSKIIVGAHHGIFGLYTLQRSCQFLAMGFTGIMMVFNGRIIYLFCT